MKAERRQAVRVLLRAHEDGLSTADIGRLLGIEQTAVRVALKAMPDCYIDRWQKPARGPLSGVWCAVYVPDHCPRPRENA